MIELLIGLNAGRNLEKIVLQCDSFDIDDLSGVLTAKKEAEIIGVFNTWDYFIVDPKPLHIMQ